MNNKKTYYVAMGGVIAALSVVIMFLTGLFPVADLALPGMAGVLLIAVVIEAGPGWAFLIFAAVSILSVFLTPDKTAAVYYITFFGHYPIIKRFIESIRAKWAQWIVKYAYFDICMALSIALTVFVSGMPSEFKTMTYAVFLILLFNVTFLVYDFALTRLIVLYVSKIRKIFKF